MVSLLNYVHVQAYTMLSTNLLKHNLNVWTVWNELCSGYESSNGELQELNYIFDWHFEAHKKRHYIIIKTDNFSQAIVTFV